MENLGSIVHQRVIEVQNNLPAVESELRLPLFLLIVDRLIVFRRYLIVVDSRQSEYSAIDISKLTDRATADIDRIPYYVTGSLDAEDVKKRMEFRLSLCIFISKLFQDR